MDTAAFRRSWQRAWSALGVPADEALMRTLLARHREPQRRYHDARHLAECLAWFDEARPVAERAGEVEVALWFHDAVHRPGRDENEALSAAWARRELLAAGVAADAAGRVFDLVMATRHEALPGRPDERLLVDIDLAILGAPAARFDEYEAQIRDEYAHVGDDAFRAGRRRVLEGFLARPAIYSTGFFRDRLEAAARANLARALDRPDG